MAINIDSLTLGEVAKVEELSKQSITTISDSDSPKGLALAALVFVMKRRETPAFTWEDALNTSAADANDVLGLGDGEPEEADPLEQPSRSSKAKQAAKKK